MIRRLAIVLAVWIGWIGPAGADAISFADANREAMAAVIVPGYENFALTSADLAEVMVAYCRGEDSNLDALHAAYHAAADAWQSIQLIRFGPIANQDRHARIQFWPDARNITSRHIGKLLKEADPARLAPDRFAEGSVAIQGFPALERMLFGKEPALPGRFSCDVSTAIARALETVSADVVQEWRDEASAIRQAFDAPGPDRPPFQSHKEATQAVFGSMSGAIEAIKILKLEKPMGKGIEKPRPRLAESWRSGRSLRNIRLNLEAVSALYRAAFVEQLALTDAGGGLNGAILGGIDAALLLLRDDDAMDLTGDGYVRLQLVLAQLGLLQQILQQDLAGALGFGLSFNALDGD